MDASSASIMFALPLLHLLDVHFQKCCPESPPAYDATYSPCVRADDRFRRYTPDQAACCSWRTSGCRSPRRTAARYTAFRTCGCRSVAARPLLHLLLHIGERRIVDNRFVMVFKRQAAWIRRFARRFPLMPPCACTCPVEAFRYKKSLLSIPCIVTIAHASCPAGRPARRVPPFSRLRHVWASVCCGRSDNSQSACSPSPTYTVQKSFRTTLRCRRVDFIRHQLVVLHDISIRHGTDPASVLLSPGNDAFDLSEKNP